MSSSSLARKKEKPCLKRYGTEFNDMRKNFQNYDVNLRGVKCCAGFVEIMLMEGDMAYTHNKHDYQDL